MFHILVGDIIPLEQGDVLCADGVLLESMQLNVDESSVTGESHAIIKGHEDPFMVSGSKVSEGVGKMVVVAVGQHSFHGKTMMSR